MPSSSFYYTNPTPEQVITAQQLYDQVIEALNIAQTTGTASITAAATTGVNNINTAATTGVNTVNAATTTGTNTINGLVNGFKNIYYGPYASAPTTRPDSTARQAGDLYYNTASNQLYVYSGSVWNAAYFSGSGFMVGTNNLSEITSASSARTNLGLGGAAVLNVGTTTGTVAAGDDSRITGAAQKASNLSDLASAATARTNLGLGTAATLASTAVAQTANNLSDLASASTARTNLGLGGLATVTPGTGVATAAGNAVNATGGFITYTTYSPASGKTLTVSNSLTLSGTDGKTLGVSNSITLAGTDGTTMTFPSSSATIGYLNIPQVSKTAAYTPTDTSDVGKHISITTGGVTINASIYSAGDVFTIYNNSASSQTITAGTNVTFRLAGTATTGNRTLAQYGTATLLCVTGGANPVFVVSGAGVT